MLKNIVFDVGGVLLQSDKTEYLKKYITYPEDAVIVDKALFHSIERSQLDRGTIEKEKAFSQMLAKIPQRSREDAMRFYEAYMSNRKTTDGIVELVQTLKDNGYKLYVLSNFSLDFQSVIEENKLHFFKLFDGVFVSSCYKMVKPEREIYQAFLKKYGLNAEECLFIDDRAENVEAALFAGMQGFHFAGNASALQAFINAQAV